MRKTDANGCLEVGGKFCKNWIVTVWARRVLSVLLHTNKSSFNTEAYFFNHFQIIIHASDDSHGAEALLRCVHSHFLPHKVLMLARGAEDAFLYDKLPVLASLSSRDGKATAHVCENYACSLPASSVEELNKTLTSDWSGTEIPLWNSLWYFFVKIDIQIHWF